MRDLVRTLDAALEHQFQVTITTLLDGYDFNIRIVGQNTEFCHVDRAGDLADAIHAQIIKDFPQSSYAAAYATATDISAFSVPSVYPEPRDQEGASIQIMSGAVGMRLGHVTVMMVNAPICPLNFNGEDILAPTYQMQARQAMEIGMNLIWVAKSAEQQERNK